MKKLTSVVLALVLAIGAMISIPLTASAKTQSQAIAWCESQRGSQIEYYDENNLYQCMDFVGEYASFLGYSGVFTYGVYSARDLQYYNPGQGWTRIQGTSDLRPGDVFISTSGTYGHTGVIVAVGSNVTVIDQNHFVYNNNYEGGGYVGKHDVTRSYIWGVLRPPAFTPEIPAAVTKAYPNAVDVSSHYVGKTVFIKRDSTGKYVIADKSSPRGTESVAIVYADSGNKGGWEKFTIGKTSDGWLTFRANSNGKYVSTVNSSTSSGKMLSASASSIGAWECFRIYRNGGSTYVFSQRTQGFWWTANKIPLYTDGIDGDSFSFYDASNGNLISAPGVPDAGTTSPSTQPYNGTYYIKSAQNSNYVLNCATWDPIPSHNQNVMMWTLVSDKTQQWTLQNVGNSNFVVRSGNQNIVLNSYTWGTPVHGTNVNIYNYIAGDATQEWRFISTGVANQYYIVSASNTGVAVTATGMANYSNVNLQTLNYSASQKWNLVPAFGYGAGTPAASTHTHKYNKVTVNPTCTAKGYTLYSCAECGNSYEANYTNAKGHTWGAWKTTKAATTKATGLQERSCTVCKVKDKTTKTLPKLAAPTITGPTAKTIKTGYSKTSTDAFNIKGNTAPTVTKTKGHEKITWNNKTKKLDIAAGLPAGTYPVTLSVKNSVGTKTFKFTLTVQKAAAKPKANKEAGTYTDSVKVTLTSATKGATVYYTTDGSTPTTSSKSVKNGGTVTLKKSTTLKTMAVVSGVKNSYVTSVKYTIKTKAPDTKAAPASKDVKKNATITLTAPAGVTLYYTTDGKTNPTTATKTKVEAGKTVKIKVTKTTTIKIIAKKSGQNASSVVTRKYTVK
jgi:hypothetical protein